MAFVPGATVSVFLRLIPGVARASASFLDNMPPYRCTVSLSAPLERDSGTVSTFWLLRTFACKSFHVNTRFQV